MANPLRTLTSMSDRRLALRPEVLHDGVHQRPADVLDLAQVDVLPRGLARRSVHGPRGLSSIVADPAERRGQRVAVERGGRASARFSTFAAS